MSQLADLITALNDNTNALAAETDTVRSELDGLRAQLAAAIAAGQAPTQADLDALASINTRLGTTSTALKALGADPANPVPVPTTVPDPTATPST